MSDREEDLVPEDHIEDLEAPPDVQRGVDGGEIKYAGVFSCHVPPAQTIAYCGGGTAYTGVR
jgi:hypothetical protein